MKFVRNCFTNPNAHRWFTGSLAGLIAAACVVTPAAFADPAQDAVAQIGELSRQAEQLTESMHAAQLDLDAKVQALTDAEAAHVNDVAALDAARVTLESYQGAVNKLAASVYMGGRTDGMNAILTVASPQGLIDKMAVQKVMGAEMAAQMNSFRQLSDEALRIEAASSNSAAQAKAAADEAAAVRAELQGKQSQLQVQIAAVKSRYQALTPPQQVALAAPGAPLPAALAAPEPPAALAAPEPPAALAAPEPEAGPPVEIAALAALPSPGAGSGAGATAVQAALTRIGSPYVWGGGGPGAFDCSGLVQWAFAQAGVFLPHSSYALAAGGQSVSVDQMQPGDVVTQYSDASHVGIYVGDGLMVHASTYGIPVRVESVYNSPIYNVRRY
ncbi:MAG: peptidoglycan hydrolase RipC [Mycobacterium sp.]|nr:peptidoglycan hydrolase RipC [Mycobacterium sp.]